MSTCSELPSDKKALAYYQICPFVVHYGSVMIYGRPQSLLHLIAQNKCMKLNIFPVVPSILHDNSWDILFHLAAFTI